MYAVEIIKRFNLQFNQISLFQNIMDVYIFTIFKKKKKLHAQTPLKSLYTCHCIHLRAYIYIGHTFINIHILLNTLLCIIRLFNCIILLRAHAIFDTYILLCSCPFLMFCLNRDNNLLE